MDFSVVVVSEVTMVNCAEMSCEKKACLLIFKFKIKMTLFPFSVIAFFEK